MFKYESENYIADLQQMSEILSKFKSVFAKAKRNKRIENTHRIFKQRTCGEPKFVVLVLQKRNLRQNK